LFVAAMTGVDPDEIEIALGEFGGIWPTSIWPHVTLADLESSNVNTQISA
jgi:hypothetical protein